MEEFQEPLDESPFNLPDGWEYGGVEAMGGGNQCRVWRNEDAGLVVIYNLVDTRVSVAQLDDFSDVVETREADRLFDPAMWKIAQDLVEEYS